MVDRRLLRPDVVALGAHFLAWCVAAVVWMVNWFRYGPEPSGPLYYGAHDFLRHVDALVYRPVFELTTWFGKIASTRLASPGAWLTVSFAVLILIAGSVQWFLLGRLVLWVMAKYGRLPAVVFIAIYGLWGVGSLFLWLAA